MIFSETYKKRFKELSEWGLVGDEIYEDEYVGATIHVEEHAVEILDWNSRGNGHGGTMISLERLKKKYGKDLVAVDCGYPGESSYTYWTHMCKKGLIVGFYDDDSTFHSCEDVRSEAEGKREVIIDESQESRLEGWQDAVEDVERLYGVSLNKRTYLGGGFWGIAFDVGNGEVVKITEDPEEADQSMELVGFECRRLANIYSVDKIDGSKYAIWQEKLQPLPPTYEQVFGALKRKMAEFLNKTISVDVLADFLTQGQSGEFMDFLMSKSDNYSPIDMYVDLLEIAKEAKLKGVVLKDLHIGNMGLKNDKLAVFDIS